jgi:Zn-dependent peptidase ImmA (M78 family)
MAGVRQSINPAILAWAMKQSDMDEVELAARAKVDSSSIRSWLTGASKPNLTQLRSLAKALHRATSIFFLPEKPAEQRSIAPAFRAPIGASGPRKIGSDELHEIRSATRRQKIAAWVAKELDINNKLRLPAYNHNTEQAAVTARAWLKWDTYTQIRASSKSAANKALRAALEERGILVLQLTMGGSDCRGFSIADEQVPLIAVNSNGHVASARTFTMLHELGHLIAGEQAVCDRPDDSAERWCDRFASAFLLPGDFLIRYMKTYLKKSYITGDDLDSVRLISNRFKASHQCVALRLIELGLSDWSLYKLVVSANYEKNFETPSFFPGGATTPERRLREYGTTYPRLVIAAIDTKKISEIDGRKYLNVNGEQLASLRHRLQDVA